MKLPPNKTEPEVLAAIKKSANILAPNFTFGYFDEDDIRQQCYLYAMEVLEKEKYDPSRPLENFLYSHIRNRLLNFKRDRLRRSDAPCRACHDGNPCCDGVLCEKYEIWLARNQRKANLMRPLDLGNISDEKEVRTRVDSTVEIEAEISSALELIDIHLSIELRATYLQMRDGVNVPKTKREAVEAAIKSILGELLNGEETDSR